MVALPGRSLDALRHRLLPSAEGGASSLWPVPVATGFGAVALAAILLLWGPPHDSRIGRLAWPGDQQAATVMLQVVVASVMTATSVTFSLVVIALQVASQQFSPRLLRQFARDPVLKAVLSILVGTFAFSVTLLRSSGDGDGVPPLGMLVTFLSALAALAALVAFIAHVATSLRVDTMMVAVHADCRRGIDQSYPAGDPPRRPDPDPPPADALLVRSRRSGFVRLVDVPTLVGRAQECELVVQLEVRPGDHVVTGTPLASVWSTDGELDPELAEEVVHRGISLAFERTLQQDPSFGFRKLSDIAVKALSPGINDPVTAAHAIGHMADLLVRLAGRQLGPQAHEGEGGTVRVVTVDRDFRYYLDLACGQVRRYGSAEPSVLIALLRMLRDVALACRDALHREEVRRQVALVLGVMDGGLLEDDRRGVCELAHRVELALDGDVRGAYRDRAGETRSI